MNPSDVGGILLVDKPRGKTSFSLVAALRRRLGVRKIGHAGTLDPFATGVMVMLIGRNYTRLSDSFLGQDKEYVAEARLGITTDTYDCEGQTLQECSTIPTLDEIKQALTLFQGDIQQIPPMYSAKKIQGKKLYELARAGKEVERAPVKVNVTMELLEYTYPVLKLHVKCSKGTYIRSLAHDMGQHLSCGAHLTALRRIRSGPFQIQDCIDGKLLDSSECEKISLTQSLRTHTP